MTGRQRMALGLGLTCLVAACNRGPDPMSIVQSPAEYNCRLAVAEVSGSRKTTLLALARTESGAEAQIKSDRDGIIYTCRTNPEGAITQLFPGLGSPT